MYIFIGITKQTTILPEPFPPYQHLSISKCSSLASSSLSSLSWALLPALALYALASTMVSAMYATSAMEFLDVSLYILACPYIMTGPQMISQQD